MLETMLGSAIRNIRFFRQFKMALLLSNYEQAESFCHRFKVRAKLQPNTHCRYIKGSKTFPADKNGLKHCHEIFYS